MRTTHLVPNALVLAGALLMLADGRPGHAENEYPLLGPIYSQGSRQVFCEGVDGSAPQPDSASLEGIDVRTRVQPGVSDGKHVHFNAYWEDCLKNLPAHKQAPKTCGEYRALRDEGEMLQKGWHTVAASGPNSGMSAEDYNDLWRQWGGGLTGRPENFDEMVTLRYGRNSPNYPNPYPIRRPDGTMEDPNETDGGSGQLPIDRIQGRDAEGKWTGRILNVPYGCAGCHGGQIGVPGEHPVAGAYWGIPNSNADPLASNMDRDPDSPTAALDVLNETLEGFGVLSGPRGRNDASTGYELLAFMLTDWDSTGLAPDPAKHPFGPEHGRAWQDSPSWFHQGHHARKFKSGEVSISAHRMTAAACAQNLVGADGNVTAEYRDMCGIRLNMWHESLEAPDWPEELAPIDTGLAEQGAVLFHTKDLWELSENEGKERPEGNGSCAGCHGAYSPKYANDPAFLPSPEFTAVASYVVPHDIIGAELERHEMTTTDFADTWDQSWWSYPEGKPGYVDPAEKTPLMEKADDNRLWAELGLEPEGQCKWARTETQGYLAPSLIGIWAVAPYMHNGSVPTVWEMLDSTKRKTIWRRELQTIGPVSGFDQSFATGYDFEKMGWKYDELRCEDHEDHPYLSCNPIEPEKGPPLTTVVQNLLHGESMWTGTVHLQYADDPELRFVYDTRNAGDGNEGHDFADGLTDAERRAIIEYLKTL